MSRSTRTAVVLVLALVMASIASYGVYRAIERIPVREVEVARAHTVVAARELPIGTMLTEADLKLVPWPAASPVPESFTAIDKVTGRGLVVPVAPNEPITESKLAPVGMGAGLPPTIPPGMRALSVRVNDVVGVAGFVVPGTRVDVLVTVSRGQGGESQTRLVVSNIQVAAAGTRYDQEAAREDGKPIPTTVVTLLATPEDAERITLASTEGKVMLALRNPLDTLPAETNGVKMANLLGSKAPPPPTVRKVQERPVVVASEPKPTIYTVEAIRAAKRTEEVVR